MSTRTSDHFLIAALLVLSGCDQLGKADTMAVDPKSPDTVLCQVDGAAKVEPVCRGEVSGDRLTIRHPDGGFRRFRIVTDGRGVVAADGSDPASVTITQGDRITVKVGTDLYDLQAQIASPK
ncbi:hypothetical protein BH11PSE5_BH11PSE5_30270 [soil metagenome]